MSPSLRKAAVLVSTLDSASAAALLDQMPIERAEQVRKAADELCDVSDAERDEVLREFLGADDSPESVATSDEFEGIELAGGLASSGGRYLSDRESYAHAQPTPAAHPTSLPFAFLHTASADSLAPLLARETPQTIAVVVAHLPPGQAAEVLARLTPRMQTDVLRRIAHLEEMHPEILAEIERQIERLVRGELRTERRKTAGLATVSAILSAADGPERHEMLDNLARFAGDLASELGSSQHAAAATSRAAQSISPRPAAHPATPLPISPSFSPVRPAKAQPTQRCSFADFAQLDNASLGAVLRGANSQTALLALAGAPRPLVDRILRQLAAGDAATLERQMERLGPLRLRDIEAAQQALADLADELASRGEVRLPAAPERMTFVA